MKTHTELLTELIEAVYALPPNASLIQLIALQMKAAEIKGQMMVTCDHCPFAQLDATAPQPDADGWVVNTGVDPDCVISAWKLKSGFEGNVKRSSEDFDWGPNWDRSTITHYKPA